VQGSDWFRFTLERRQAGNCPQDHCQRRKQDKPAQRTMSFALVRLRFRTGPDQKTRVSPDSARLLSSDAWLPARAFRPASRDKEHLE
jgi:hypothetical protein